MNIQFPASIDITNLNGMNGFVVTGLPGSYGGWAVNGAGDINGDGIADVVVGGPYGNNNYGVSYVIFGHSGASQKLLSADSLMGPNGFLITGFPAYCQGGFSVSGAGDINDDGIADMMIGARLAFSGSGACYVLFGRPGMGSSGSFDISSLTGSNGFVITGFPSNSEGGFAINQAGDINGDGISDVIIGAPVASSGTGLVYVLFGKSGIGRAGIINVAALTGADGFVITGFPAYSGGGYSVSGSGDINGDGIADLIIGAPVVGAGAAYIVFGQSGIGSSGSLDISSLTGSNGFTITGFLSGSQGGNSVSGVDDINGDGISDLIIGAPGAFSGMGVVYLLFGKSGIGSAGTVNVAALTGANGFVITGFPANSGAGYSVSGIDDINGDGIADFVIGAPYPSYEGDGISYVLFGKSGIGSSGAFSVASLKGSNGFSITGVATRGQIGFSVSGVGDFNSDGIADLVIGAIAAYGYTGASYVIFGELAPVPVLLLKNQLTVSEDQALILSSQYLNASVPSIPSKDSLLQFTLSGIQHCRLYSSTNKSLSITNFLQQQVREGQIRFTHDGSGWAPKYNISISYGLFATTFPQTATISFQQSFVLVNHQLTINQGQRITLTINDLSANDLYNSANNPNLVFSVTNVQNSYFALASAPTITITRFTQAQIQSNVVQFVHDDSINPPSFSVAVFNGAASIAPQNATISFDAMPVLTTNQLTINQGEAIAFTADNLSAVNPYDAQAALTFVVSQVQHGYFALIGTTTPIATFTPAQIQNGNIQFVHDGSVYPPSYSVAVTDGRMTSPVQSSVISFDAIPVVIFNQLHIDQGQTIVLDAGNLSATNPYNPQANLTFIISDIEHGYFALVNVPSIPITAFSQAQIQKAQIQFVHDGSVQSPSYRLSVSDGRLTSTSQTSNVSFDAIPIFIKNILIVNQGQTVILTLQELNAVNPYDSSAQLTFAVSSVLHGHFELVNSAGIAIITFTQQQIRNQEIQFVQDGTPNAPSYSISVSDGRLTSASQAATISFDVPPILISNNLKINDAETVILTSNNLSASHPFASLTELFFLVSDIQHGNFELINNPGTSIDRFTQGQVQAGEIRFVSDASNKAPSYKVTVSDGRMVALGGPHLALITFNDRPILKANQLKISQGETVILGSSDLSAIDQETPAASLIFTAKGVEHGYFEDASIPGIPTTVFAQQRIISGGMKFVTDGNAYPPAYNVSVSDGVLSSPSAKAIINFSIKPAETPTSDPVRNAIIGGVVSGIVGLLFLALKVCLERKAANSLKKVLEGGKSETEKRLISFQKEVIKPIVDKIFAYIKTTKCLGYRSDKMTKAYVSAIEGIIEKIADLGVDLNFNKMSITQQNKLLNEIAKQTRLQVVADYSCCSCAYVGSFFKPETTPQQLEDSAGVIAAAVQAAMRSQFPRPTRKVEQKQELLEDAEMQEIPPELAV